MAVLLAAGSFPYATAAIVGTGSFAFGYLFAKKVTPSPNDNLKYLLFGIGYVNPEAANTREPVSNGRDPDGKPLPPNQRTDLPRNSWEAAIDWAKDLLKKEVTPFHKPGDAKTLYWDVGNHNGTLYTTEELWQLMTTGVDLVGTGDVASDVSIQKLYTAVGGVRIGSTSDPNALEYNFQNAKNVQSFYSYPTAGNPKDTSISLADKAFIDYLKTADPTIIERTYGKKELSHGDILQLFVAAEGATKPATFQTDATKRAYFEAGDWVRMTEDQRASYLRQIKANAKAWADQVGRGAPVPRNPATAPPPAPSAPVAPTTNPAPRGGPSLSVLSGVLPAQLTAPVHLPPAAASVAVAVTGTSAPSIYQIIQQSTPAGLLASGWHRLFD